MSKNIQCSFERTEKKYLLTKAQYAALRAGIRSFMQADCFGRYTICNIYYDTEDFSLIRSSIEKPIYKEKLRLRSYGVPDDDGKVFIEIKKKFDSVVYKRREILAAGTAADYLNNNIAPEKQSQILDEINWFLKSYQPQPAVFIAYDRLALAGLENPELRITFDTRLRWRSTELDLRCGDWGAPLLAEDRVLMEIKIPGAAPIWLSRLLSEVGAFPTSFSKYGLCYKQHLLAQNTETIRKAVSHCA